MVSVSDAQKIILKFARPLGKEKVPLSKSLGFILAENVYAPISLPVADNSAMDGFVLRSRDTRTASQKNPVYLEICGSIQAGSSCRPELKPCEVYRIMTGASVPRGGDAILVKERAVVKENRLAVTQFLPRGLHIRYRGEEIKKGQLVLKRHSVIHPATVGIFASLGKGCVKVFKKPRIGIIATGHELVRPGSALRVGQIYDSNSFMLECCLKSMGVLPLCVERVGDRPYRLRILVKRALRTTHILILTGGVSGGDYDYVKDILRTCGVQTIFWKVNQKPGKPLYFGKKDHTLVFGLPGNPASVFTCFYEYVFPAIRQIMGFQYPYLKREKAVLQKEVDSDSKKFLFLKAYCRSNGKATKVKPLGFQGSHMISSLQETNCVILVPPSNGRRQKGERVEIDLLPWDGGGAS